MKITKRLASKGLGNNSPASFMLRPAKGVACALAATLGIGLLATSLPSLAGSRERAEYIYSRLTGTLPNDAVLDAMVIDIDNNNLRAAALKAIDDADNPSFYNVTLKNWAAPWTNRDFDIFASFNDYTATIIGLVRDEADFREVLYGDVIYVGTGSAGETAYSNSNNTHYEDLEAAGVDLSDPAKLARRTQSQVTGLPPAAAAGVMTTRAAARAFFIDGTNRAMFRFTLVNHLCNDMEQVKDITRAADRIRQDVSRSPGGDSSIFLTNCVGCHSGMDPLAQSFAYYQWQYEDEDPETEDDPEAGHLVYTPGVVQEKYFNNDDTFRSGYVTPNDRWDNYWRVGPNSAIFGWDTNLPGTGTGAAGMGQELAHSDLFAWCQVKKVFRVVCLREPTEDADYDLNTGNGDIKNDRTGLDNIVADFQDNGHVLKNVFADVAGYCSAHLQ